MSDAPGRRGVARGAEQQEGLARTGQLIAVVFFGVAATCGFFSAAQASQPVPTSTVSVLDYSFSPVQIEVPAGRTIVFRNNGRVLHRIVADDGGFDSHGLQPAHTWSVALGTQQGVIAYHDTIYPQMKGRIVITSAPTPVDAFANPTTATTASTKTGANTTTLASTGSATRMLALVAVAFLAFGIAALVLARPSPVRLVVLGPLYSDDLLPIPERHRVRR